MSYTIYMLFISILNHNEINNYLKNNNDDVQKTLFKHFSQILLHVLYSYVKRFHLF